MAGKLFRVYGRIDIDDATHTSSKQAESTLAQNPIDFKSTVVDDEDPALPRKEKPLGILVGALPGEVQSMISSSAGRLVFGSLYSSDFMVLALLRSITPAFEAFQSSRALKRTSSPRSARVCIAFSSK